MKVSKQQEAKFSPQLLESLLGILASMGCREMPTPCKIQHLILEVARYELTVKPLGAMYSLRGGVPTVYHDFWNTFSVQDLFKLYRSLNATPESILNILTTSDDTDLDANKARVFSYLKTFIGNLTHQDIRNFLRFVTGSSVMIDKKITVSFNYVTGLARRPVSHTCNCILELPATYPSYPEFAEEFLIILRSEIAWPMDCI